MNRDSVGRSRDDVTARVMRMVTDLCGDESCPIQPILAQCVDDAIAVRWPSPVNTFVPLLAFRDVRECIRRGSCPPRAAVVLP